jgi:HSP20 family protein
MPVLEKWTPFRELDLIDRRMRRLFSELGVAPALTPAADIYERGDEYVVELEVPGYDEQDLDIEVIDHTLTVKGARREETEKKENDLRLHERLESSFERSFVLPAEVDSPHLKAMYGKGVLTLHLPKAVKAEPLKIEIEKV